MEPTPGTSLDLAPQEQPDSPAVCLSKFEAFHTANPHIYANMVEHALQLKARKKRDVGVRFLLEYERNERPNPTPALDSTEDFVKINNNFSPLYGRLMEEKEPKLRGFLRMRKTRAEMDNALQTAMEFD